MSNRWRRLLGAAGLSLALLVGWLLFSPPPAASSAPAAAPIVVNSPFDQPDLHPGDGACETGSGNGVCTLRGAIQEANARPGADTIQLQAATTYVLDRVDATHMDQTALTGDLDITDSVTLLGAGPASTIIDGNGSVLGEHVFDVSSTVVISGVTIENGRANTSTGGGLHNDGRLTLDHTWVISNVVDSGNDYGGGVFTDGPALTVTHSLIRGNRTGSQTGYGGGLMNNSNGTMAVLDSVISDNVTTGTTAFGGGLYAPTLIVDSTISGNSARQGGGIYSPAFFLALAVVNSTLAGNNSSSDGGGLYAASGLTQLFNTTLAGNLANSDFAGSAQGGGVFVDSSATLDFANSLIAGNGVVALPGPARHADDCHGVLISGSNNLVQTDNCTINGPYLHANPLLGPLQDNGGPTPTQALLPGSPAIDAGAPGGCTDHLAAPLATDQRGRPRTANGAGATRCDIGAFEAQRTVFMSLLLR